MPQRLGPATWTLIVALLALFLWILAIHGVARGADRLPRVLAGAPAYDRQEWHPRWEDADGNCRDTRQEVLAREAFPGTVVWDDEGCKVRRGLWRDPYTGERRTDPAHLDIDHVVPLAWAHAHGGAAWSTERKRAFANELGYPGALAATIAAVNRSKGSKGPAEWVPPRDGTASCDYGQRWAIMLVLYDLTPSDADREALRLLVRKC
jgi:hypothetical protein